MIIALMFSVILTAFTGMAMIAGEGIGPLAGTPFANLPSEALEDVHEFLADLTSLLVVLHVVGVVVSSLLHRENLVTVMITGRKGAVEEPSVDFVPSILEDNVKGKADMNRSRLRQIQSCAVVVVSMIAFGGHASELDKLFDEYRTQGARTFDPAAGETFWRQQFGGKSCTSCHAESPRKYGRHARTGKTIEPVAPSVNPDRLTDLRHIEKWLLRNCK